MFLVILLHARCSIYLRRRLYRGGNPSSDSSVWRARFISISFDLGRREIGARLRVECYDLMSMKLLCE